MDSETAFGNVSNNPYPASRLAKAAGEENIDLYKILEKKSQLYAKRVSDIYGGDN